MLISVVYLYSDNNNIKTKQDDITRFSKQTNRITKRI